MLKRLSQRYDLIVCSNAKREFIDTQLDFTDLKHYFTHIFSSTSDYHTVKKVTDFYDAQQLQQESERAQIERRNSDESNRMNLEHQATMNSIKQRTALKMGDRGRPKSKDK